MSADRNLLYGMLAYLNGFISREQLLDAFTVWMGRKEAPLGELLRERASLTEEDQRFLDAFVERQIRHHGDALQSLASLRVDPMARRDLEQLRDPDVQASLATVTDRPPSQASNGEGSAASAFTRAEGWARSTLPRTRSCTARSPSSRSRGGSPTTRRAAAGSSARRR
jgi:hypothetical protein